MPIRFKQRLIAHLKHDSYTPSDIQTLIRDLRIDEADAEAFKEAVNDLAESGQLVLDKNLVTLPPIGRELIGRFKRNAKGFGFIIPNDPNAHGDLFVPIGNTMDALTGDVVKAEVIYQKRRGDDDRSPYIGNIVEIIKRKQSNFTGTLVRRGGMWIVDPDGKVVTDPIVVRDAQSSGANEGDKVVVEILHFPEGDYLGEGVITKVLGEAGEPNVETQAVIEAYGLPGEFAEEVMEEARVQTKRFDEEIAELTGGKKVDATVRRDLRESYIITIDPPDAKDYDDALSLEKIGQEGGGGSGGAVWRLGVHIADVAHFVEPGGAIDREATERTTSVYLPRKVIPMLPEILSNGICSLQEGVERFCKSAFIDYDEKGQVKARGYAQTLIKSAKRLTYLEAQALIEGDETEAKKHAKTEPRYTEQLVKTLRQFDRLAKRIEERRRKAGMIHLELPDVELVYDDQGRVVDAVPEDDAYTHTLIEMFMVEANEAIAVLFEDLGVPVLRRTHPEPVPGSTESLQGFVRVAGYRIPKAPTREDLQALLDATKGSPAAPAIHMAVLRTLTRAQYSPALIGHFALASNAYSHFTSPIRRYPDLTAHRALAEYLRHTKNGTEPPRTDSERKALGKKLRESPACPDEQALQVIASRCNNNEENAESAERELRQFLVLQLLEQHIGESFPGIVTGVMNRGVFVRLDKYLAEGMCDAADLPVPAPPGAKQSYYKKGIWRIDTKSGALVEQNTGRSYNIGDRVDVTIAAVDLPRRQMELVITDASSRTAGKNKSVASGLKLGEVEFEKPQRTGADKRAARSKSRDKRKSDFRGDRKGKGKRQ